MKTKVYSWRISSDRKANLEDEAQRQGISMASLLDRITHDWLQEQRASRNGDEAEQAAIRKRVMATVGTIRGRDPRRAQRAGELVREIIRRKHEKESYASRRTR